MVNENVKYAIFPQRLMAYNIDMMIVLFAIVLLSLFISDNQILAIVAILLIVVYHGGMESSKYQATLGKQYFKMKVVNRDGLQVAFGVAYLRILLKFISLLLVFGGFFMIYLRQDRKGLHDLVVGSYVIQE